MRKEPSAVLNLFQQGDRNAFETLFHQHRCAVYGWILRIVRNAATAEDLTAESFWRIWRARARFNPAMGFEGWARRIATRVALDHLRSRRVESELSAEVQPEAAAPLAPDAAVIAEIRRKTALAFERLPLKLRIAATLAVIEEQPHKDIAAALGISVAAVKLRVFRALRLLRKDLQREGITP